MLTSNTVSDGILYVGLYDLLQVAPEHLHMIMDVIVDDCILAAVCVGIRVPTPTETDRRVRQVRDLIVRQLHDNDRHKAT